MTLDLWAFRSGIAGAGVDLRGMAVHALDGGIGKVQDVVERGSRTFLLVDTGPWIFGKTIKLPAGLVSSIDAEEGIVSVALPKDEVKSAPEQDATSATPHMRTRSPAITPSGGARLPRSARGPSRRAPPNRPRSRQTDPLARWVPARRRTQLRTRLAPKSSATRRPAAPRRRPSVRSATGVPPPQATPRTRSRRHPPRARVGADCSRVHNSGPIRARPPKEANSARVSTRKAPTATRRARPWRPRGADPRRMARRRRRRDPHSRSGPHGRDAAPRRLRSSRKSRSVSRRGPAHRRTRSKPRPRLPSGGQRGRVPRRRRAQRPIRRRASAR